MTIIEICQWLESTAVARLIQESVYGFPIVVAIHILGMIVSVGLLLWMDLRLLGVAFTGSPVSVVVRRLTPWFVTGFTVMFLSGASLFAGYAAAAYGNPYFRIKMAAIVLAGLIALVYHFVTERRMVLWDHDARPPTGARLAGLISLVLWTTVILSGRMMSYTMF